MQQAPARRRAAASRARCRCRRAQARRPPGCRTGQTQRRPAERSRTASDHRPKAAQPNTVERRRGVGHLRNHRCATCRCDQDFTRPRRKQRDDQSDGASRQRRPGIDYQVGNPARPGERQLTRRSAKDDHAASGPNRTAAKIDGKQRDRDREVCEASKIDPPSPFADSRTMARGTTAATGPRPTPAIKQGRKADSRRPHPPTM